MLIRRAAILLLLSALAVLLDHAVPELPQPVRSALFLLAVALAIAAFHRHVLQLFVGHAGDPLPDRVTRCAIKAGVPVSCLLFDRTGKGDAMALGLRLRGPGSIYLSGRVLDHLEDDESLSFVIRHEHEHNQGRHSLIPLFALLASGLPVLMIPAFWISEILADRAAAKSGFAAEGIPFNSIDLLHPPGCIRRMMASQWVLRR